MRKLVGALLLSLLLTAGCSSGPPPEKVTRDFFDAMIRSDFETAAKFAGGANIKEDVLKTTEDEQSERLAKSILARITYEVGDKKVEGNKAEVSVKVTAPDLLRITSKAMSELLPMAFAMAFSENQSQEKTDALFQQYFENAINDPNAPMTTSDVKVKLEKKDGSWIVKPDDELLNALTGNMTKAFDELDNKAGKAEGAVLPLTDRAIGEPFTVPASKLNPTIGQPDLTGDIKVTVEEYEFSASIRDAFTGRGTIEPRGRFLVIYYSVANDLNVEMQPATQISDYLYITDAQGRRWKKADYTADYGGVSGSAAVAKGHRQPEEFVQPGFKNTTAVVFDLPQDATDGLALVWEHAGIRIALQ